MAGAGNTKGGSITVPLTSCLTGLESAVSQLTIFVFFAKQTNRKPVKQEVNGKVILPPLVFPGWSLDKLQPTGQNLGRVFNYRSGHVHAVHLLCYEVKLPSLKLKNLPKQLLGSITLHSLAIDEMTLCM